MRPRRSRREDVQAPVARMVREAVRWEESARVTPVTVGFSFRLRGEEGWEGEKRRLLTWARLRVRREEMLLLWERRRGITVRIAPSALAQPLLWLM